MPLKGYFLKRPHKILVKNRRKERPYFRLYKCNYLVGDCNMIQHFIKILLQIIFS